MEKSNRRYPQSRSAFSEQDLTPDAEPAHFLITKEQHDEYRANQKTILAWCARIEKKLDKELKETLKK